VIRSRLDRFDGAAFIQDLLDSCKQSLAETAKQVPIDLTERIDEQITPEGKSQKRNTPRYAAWKARRYGHITPLLREGVLRDHNLYRLRKRGWDWMVAAPLSRRDAVGHLEQRGYSFWGISPEVVGFLAAQLELRLRAIESRIRRYTLEGT
jgi:hypothetical protein